ncbi:IS5 family transposase [Methanoculleus sp. FWC-SCC1]|uniref:IS5 family transposase n=1 Tax=Methanoculleus frigidifontis TaxID=2584085 RepID=A0ABT8MEC2_9EURY|nr:IS5 family transposase [Methanoculleus sp. FWC-SCC1]MDN7026251.1 IS5 family transposase [Methanoculleus sp. FWC-SCC1]
MSTFTNFIIRHEYASLAALGDRLGEVSGLIDWDAFRPLLADLYTNAEGRGGRPNCDVVLMIKLLVLQQWYGLSDPELERQATDRISFRHFLGYPETIPDRSTVWLFRERLAKTGKETLIWDEFQRQLEEQGLTIKRGVMQDASFITADPGHAPADTPRGEQARTRRSRDGTWAKKGSKSQFGYKLHILMDKDHQLIRRIETTTASLHDSRIDLSRKGETVYRDKGYFGVKPKASMDKTMHRATRGHPLSIKENRRNKAISRTRSLVERPFAVMKRVLKAGHLMVTTVARVRVKNTFSCMDFNLRQLLTLKAQAAER